MVAFVITAASGTLRGPRRSARAGVCARALRMQAGNVGEETRVSRRSLLTGALAAAVAVVLGRGQAANARIDYEGIPFLGGSDKIDVNNANIRVYTRFPGFYPSIAKKIVTGAPYKSPEDILRNPELTEKEKDLIKQQMDHFVTLPPQSEYVVDQVNNGLYR